LRPFGAVSCDFRDFRLGRVMHLCALEKTTLRAPNKHCRIHLILNGL
jgi:hypothetical protein